jgi:hypothetical protein
MSTRDHKVAGLAQRRRVGRAGQASRRHPARRLPAAAAPRAAEDIDVATRGEAMALLTALAREGRTQAVIALARELREGDPDLTYEWILHGSD